MALDLDRRQRAMLEEMGIRVWLPEETAPASVAPAAGPGPASSESRAPAEARMAPPPPRPAPPPASPELMARASEVGSMDWAALQAAVAGCRACGLCKGRRNTVFGVGPERADWMIVGEAPGEQEDLTGEPFVGPSGQLLDNMLRALRLHRLGRSATAAGSVANVYIANVVKCRPPANRNPEPQEVVSCAPFLRRQIELLQPRIIIGMGRFATQSLLQGVVQQVEAQPLGKLRGKVYRYQTGSASVPVVVTYHPAYLLRSLPAKAQAWEDLCLALEVVRQQEQPGAAL